MRGSTTPASEASLAGWVNRRRDLGQLIFIDLRDRYGMTQVVIDRRRGRRRRYAIARAVRSEFVLAVRGAIVRRLDGTGNPRHGHRRDRAACRRHQVLTEARTPPFDVNERGRRSTRLCASSYRYLDLRREPLQQRILARGGCVQGHPRVPTTRPASSEIETPLLIKSTPEGARDFIVPVAPAARQRSTRCPRARSSSSSCSWSAGFDRYFQIARCLRDEDLRGDRQPEFTQLDLEMAFVREDDVMAWVEQMALARDAGRGRPSAPSSATRSRGSRTAKPSTASARTSRTCATAWSSHDLDELAAASGFRVFETALAEGGRVVGLALPGLAGVSGPRSTSSTEQARRGGARGLVWLALDGQGGIRGSIVKAVGEELSRQLAAAAGGEPGDLVLIVADADITAQEALGALRVKLADRIGAYDRDLLSLRLGAPLPDVSVGRASMRRWDATHNPFSARASR